MLLVVLGAGDAPGDELPAEPLIHAAVRHFDQGGDGDWPSSLLCGRRFYYVSEEWDGWREVDLYASATSVAEQGASHEPLGCSPSGRWVEAFGEYLDSIIVHASDDQKSGIVFEYDQALAVWAANADILFLLRDKKWWGDSDSRMAKESPVSDSTPFEVFYLEPTDAEIEKVIDGYGGISIMQMIWQGETREVLVRTGNGPVVALKFGASRQIEAISELSLDMPEGHEVSLEWKTAHVAAEMVYENSVLKTLLLIVDRSYLGSWGGNRGDEPIPYLLCPIERHRGECFTRVWQAPETDDLPHTLPTMRIATPIDLNGTLVGLYRFADRTACMAIWIGMSNEVPRCLTKDYEISSARHYFLDVRTQPEGIVLVLYNSDRPGTESKIDIYRFDYETLRALGVDG